MASSIDNLKPFQPGHDPRRNLSGRPRIIPQLDQVLRDELGECANSKSKLRAIIAKMADMAINGDIRAAQLLLDRVYGKPTEHVRMRMDAEVNTTGQIDLKKVPTEILEALLNAVQ